MYQINIIVPITNIISLNIVFVIIIYIMSAKMIINEIITNEAKLSISIFFNFNALFLFSNFSIDSI